MSAGRCRLGLPAALEAMGVERTQRPEIAEKALKDHCRATNPRLATAEEYLGVLNNSHHAG